MNDDISTLKDRVNKLEVMCSVAFRVSNTNVVSDVLLADMIAKISKGDNKGAQETLTEFREMLVKTMKDIEPFREFLEDQLGENDDSK